MGLCAPPSLVADPLGGLEPVAWVVPRRLVSPMLSPLLACCSSTFCQSPDPCVPSNQEEGHQVQAVLLVLQVPSEPAGQWLPTLRQAFPMSFPLSVCCSSTFCLSLDPCVLSNQEEGHQGQAVLRVLLVLWELGGQWLPALKWAFPMLFLLLVCCSSMSCLSLDPCALSNQEGAHQGQAVLPVLLEHLVPMVQ